MFKNYVQKKLEKYVQQYFLKHPEIKLVVVTGSVGKTSTKRAIGTVLSTRYRVRMHDGNHNTHLSAPLAILGIDMPDTLKNPLAWLSVFHAARLRIKQPTDVDVVVQELGADRPGDIAQFARYLHPDIAVVTAVTPEHMEFFKTIEAVAAEELTAANFAKLALINRDDIDGRFAEYITNPNLRTYGTTGLAEYHYEVENFTPVDGYKGIIFAPEFSSAPLAAAVKVVGEHSLRPIMGGIAVGLQLGLLGPEVTSALAHLAPVPGRMNILRGIDDCMIIDDTYNSSPAAAVAAIQTLYSLETPQRIVVLGDMNELGESSQAEHEKIGHLLNIDMVSWVVTIGEQTEKYLAPAARAQGCQVKSFKSAIDAGAFVRSITQPGAIILVKGSQGGIYAEEAVKVLCNMTEDTELVRQSPEWMRIKDDFFSKID